MYERKDVGHECAAITQTHARLHHQDVKKVEREKATKSEGLNHGKLRHLADQLALGGRIT